MKNGQMAHPREAQAAWEILKKNPPKRVALVGLGLSAYDYIRHCDRKGNRKELFDETWTVNSFCHLIEAERLFHMDDIRVQKLRAERNERVKNMLEAMKTFRGPIITSVPHEEYPQCEQFPLGQVVGQFGSLYFNNTMPYAIAYAMLIGVEHMTFFGLDYVWPNMAEAEAGRGCTEFWIGKAHAKGMVTRIAANSTLMDARINHESYHLYGYDGFTITLEDLAPGKIRLNLAERELPTAEEIEKRYYRNAPKTLEAIIGKERMEELERDKAERSEAV